MNAPGRLLLYSDAFPADACDEPSATFRSLFGNQVFVTVSTAREHARFFDWACAANRLLSPGGRREWHRRVGPICRDYEANRALLAAGTWSQARIARHRRDAYCAEAFAELFIADGTEVVTPPAEDP